MAATATDVQHSSAPVHGLLQNAGHTKDVLHTANAFLENFDDQHATLCEAAKYAEKLHDEAKVKELRAQTQQLVEARGRILQHTQALTDLRATYACTAEATDFQAKLQPRAAAAASAELTRELDERLKVFDKAVWSVHHAGEPMPGEDDDGVWVESTQDELAPNPRCPLSGKLILELHEPVKDHKGYVYEKAAILAYLHNKTKGQVHLAVDSPNVGASYKLTAGDLVLAKNVIRAAKRRQMAASQQRAGGAAEDMEVID